jgi:hypothetical protein
MDLCASIETVGTRQVCIEFIARPRDPAICDRLTDHDDRDHCLLVFAGRLPDVCDRISSPERQDECFTAASRVHPGSGELCARVRGGLAQQSCYRSAAQASPLLCEHVGLKADDPVRIECYDNAVANNTEASLCAKIPGARSAAVCLRHTGQRTGSAETCRRITIPEERDECLLSVAVRNQDESLCFAMAGELKKRQCANALSTNAHLPALCALVDTWRHDACVQSVALHTAK